MVKVVGVRFKKAGKIYYFDPDKIEIDQNDFVIVETARGMEFGIVAVGPKEVGEDDIISPLKPVIRLALEEDFQINKDNKEKAKEAMIICQEKVKDHKLDMNLVDVEYTFDNNKVIFYFTSDNRIDFRELVKDLASVFKTRIELRQIGVRDEAKIIGGIGPCGQITCCTRFLGEFAPVSIKMAKEQSLSLNPTKISGLCGRLMCCLKYEQDTYEELLVGMPSVGAIIKAPDGTGVVISSYTLLQRVRAKIKLADGTEDIFQYGIDEIELTGKYDPSYQRYSSNKDHSNDD